MIPHFTDNQGHQYHIIWKHDDITICGFFAGSINNWDEWIYANLGYNNEIQGVYSITNEFMYTLQQLVTFSKPRYEINGDEIIEATIESFYVDSFSKKIGAKFNKGVGRTQLSEL